LAARLRLPFHNIVIKGRETRPQKEMENRFHQCQNLDGVFEIHKGDVDISVAGLLVDDVTDSGWTMAIIARLLLEAGSGAIFPLALASSSAQ
jgi:ATP-dependent DNA helicase RecQ